MKVLLKLKLKKNYFCLKRQVIFLTCCISSPLKGIDSVGIHGQISRGNCWGVTASTCSDAGLHVESHQRTLASKLETLFRAQATNFLTLMGRRQVPTVQLQLCLQKQFFCQDQFVELQLPLFFQDCGITNTTTIYPIPISNRTAADLLIATHFRAHL